MVRRISLALSVTGKPHCAPLLPSIGIFQIFQISGHDNLTQTETISPFRFVITSDCLIVCAPQDASGHTISRQKTSSCISVVIPVD